MLGSYTFKWLHPANEVFVTGTFDGWEKTVKLERAESGHFAKTVQLPKTDEPIIYKFVVDGNWTTDHTTARHIDSHDNINNILFPRDIAPSATLQTSSSAAPDSIQKDANADRERTHVSARVENECIWSVPDARRRNST